MIDPAGVREESYWRYPVPAPDDPPRSEADYADELLDPPARGRPSPADERRPPRRDALRRPRLQPDRRADGRAARRAPSRPSPSASARTADNSELADARTIATRFGNRPPRARALATPTTPSSSTSSSGTSTNPSPTSPHSASSRSPTSPARHVTVALSGQGADELLGGYERHRNAALAATWRRLPRPLRSAALRLAEIGPARVRRAGAILSPDEPIPRLLALYGRDVVPGLRAVPQGHGNGDGSARRALSRVLGTVGDRDPLATILYVDAQLALPDDMLHYFDRTSMAHSLEVRVPFLDHELVEYCARIPTNLKVHHLTTKHVLKHAARGILPDHIIDKRKMGFFNRSVDQWMATRGRAAIEESLLDVRPAVGEIVDMATVRALHEAGDAGLRPLFRVLMLELWLRDFLPRATRRADPVRAGHA